MGIGVAIRNSKEKLKYSNYTEMAKAIGVSSSVLNRLKDVNTKEDMKQENIEVLEKVSIFLGMSINDLINFEIDSSDSQDSQEDTKILNINPECNDVGIIINEVKEKIKETSGIKLDGFLMNEESKQILIDSLDISKKLAINKL